MLLTRLLTILIINISSGDITSTDTNVDTGRRILCFRNYQIWYCSKNEKCGTIYNSCIPDPSLLNSSSEGGLGLIGIFFWLLLCFFGCWCRAYRRKQAEKKFIRQVQTIVAEVQQPRTVYVVVDPSAVSIPLTSVEPPPSYEQIIK